MGIFHRGQEGSGTDTGMEKTGSRSPLPVHKGQVDSHSNGAAPVKKTKGIKEKGESGRRGIHPLKFFHISFRSSSRLSRVVNILWPVVPAAIVCRYVLEPTPHNHLVIFILSYIAMVPCANLIGFAGQELARKVPHVFGVLVETT